MPQSNASLSHKKKVNIYQNIYFCRGALSFSSPQRDIFITGLLILLASLCFEKYEPFTQLRLYHPESLKCSGKDTP